MSILFLSSFRGNSIFWLSNFLRLREKSFSPSPLLRPLRSNKANDFRVVRRWNRKVRSQHVGCRRAREASSIRIRIILSRLSSLSSLFNIAYRFCVLFISNPPLQFASPPRVNFRPAFPRKCRDAAGRLRLAKQPRGGRLKDASRRGPSPTGAKHAREARPLRRTARWAWRENMPSQCWSNYTSIIAGELYN